MSSESDADSPTGRAASGSSGSTRPHMVLDATATEVTSNDPRSASSENTPEQIAGVGKDAPISEEERAASEADEQPPLRSEPRASQRSPSPSGVGPVLTHLTAGALGGAVALIALNFLPPEVARRFAPGGGSDGAADRLERRMSTLEEAMPLNAVAAGDQKLAAANARIEKLEGEIGSLSPLREAQSKIGTDIASLNKRVESNDAGQRLAGLEQQLATIAAAAKTDPGNSTIPDIAAITSRLAALDRQLSELGSRVDVISRQDPQPSSKAIEAEVGDLRRGLTSVSDHISRLDQKVAGSIQEAEQRRQGMSALQESLPTLKSAIDAVAARVDGGLKSAITAADVGAAVEPVAGRVAAVELRLGEVVRADDQRRANAERILLSLELSGLKRAIEDGVDYSDELDAVRAAGSGTWDLSALERYAGKRVPTLPELQASFRGASRAMADAQSDVGDGSVLDRFMAGARSVVRVRKTDHAAADTTIEAVLGRMEKHLKSGQLSETLGEAANLPEPSAKAGAAWLDQASARYAIDQAIAKIEDQLKASLTPGQSATSSDPR